MLATMQHHRGLPPYFWDDPRVLGFFGFFIAYITAKTLGPNATRVAKGQAMFEAFEAVSSRRGTGLRWVEMQAAKVAEFELAADDAATLALFMDENLRDAQLHPAVISATESARIYNGGREPTRDEIAGALNAEMLTSLFDSVLADE